MSEDENIDEIRRLASGWADERAWSRGEGVTFTALSASDLDTLRQWVVREMVREVERRRASRLSWPAAELGMASPPLDDSNREALARHIASLLGDDFDTIGDDGQHYVTGGLAWSLCEWAGWPA